MNDKKELLETKLELNDEQLEKVGGGINPITLCYGYCHECGWKSDIVIAKKVPGLINEHKNQTGHSDVVRKRA
ncbi:MAG: hypothetical protein ACOX4Q_03705 [Syntrophomonadales bacterium]